MTGSTEKGDRALELREAGLGRIEIAERLGVPPNLVDGMVRRARKRRATRQRTGQSEKEQTG